MRIRWVVAAGICLIGFLVSAIALFTTHNPFIVSVVGLFTAGFVLSAIMSIRVFP